MDDAVLHRLMAESEIRRTMAKTFLAVDGRQFHEYSQQYAEDAVHGEHRGRAAILESISNGALARNPRLRRKHLSPNVVIDVEGNEARAVSDLVMFSQFDEEPYTIRIGEYRDHLCRQDDGRWLFVERRLEIQREAQENVRRLIR